MANIPFLNNAYFSAKVGIGTDSPGAKLEVTSQSQTLPTAKFDSIELQTYTVNNSWVGENLYYDGSFKYRADGYATALYFDGSGFDIRTAPNGPAGTVATLTTRFTILESNGNVGIGTTSPGDKLEITGSTATAGDTTLHLKVPVGNITAGVTEMGKILFSSSDASAGGTGAVAKISTIAGDGTTAWIGSGRPTDLAFFTQPLGAAAVLVEAMRIDQDGNVGIGTTSPGYKLEVNSGTTNNIAKFVSSDGGGLITVKDSSGEVAFSNVGNDIFFKTSSSQTNQMSILNSGNVGIGTTGPAYKLDVDETTSGNLIVSRFKHNQSGVASAMQLENRAGGVNSAFDINWGLNSSGNQGTVGVVRTNLPAAGGSEMYFKTSYGEVMRLDGDGNVGIGTTSPTEKLEVVGNIKIQAALLSNQENTDVDIATETVANVLIADYTAAFYDFVIKKGTNVRSGTVYACHDGTNVEYTETSTNDLGDTSDVTLSVGIYGTNMKLLATATSADWSVKSLIRAI